MEKKSDEDKINRKTTWQNYKDKLSKIFLEKKNTHTRKYFSVWWNKGIEEKSKK